MKYFVVLLSLIFAGAAVAQTPEKKSVALGGATSIDAQLTGALDVGKARVGDAVVLKTTQAVRQGGEVIIPKGANVVGRVTEVAQKGKSGAVSKLGVVFDRVQGKNLDAPISATITSILSAGGGVRTSDAMADADIMGGGTTTAGGGSRNGGGGGLLGGVGNTVGGVGNTVGGVVGGATQTVGGVTDSVGRTTSGVANGATGALRNISITQSVEGSASGSTVISSGDKNLRLEKGAVFKLAVSGAQPE